MEVVFTIHAENQIKERGILKQDIIDSIKRPDNIIKKHGKYYYQNRLNGGIIEIVCERMENNIKVVTVYWL